MNLRGRRIECISFADDKALVAESKKALLDIINRLDVVSEEYGMKININKLSLLLVQKINSSSE